MCFVPKKGNRNFLSYLVAECFHTSCSMRALNNMTKWFKATPCYRYICDLAFSKAKCMEMETAADCRDVSLPLN